MTEYLEPWRKVVQEREMRVSTPKTQWMECRFEQAERVDRQTVKISEEELEKVNNSST